MNVAILREAGLDEALLGLSLSYQCQPDKDLLAVARKLAGRDGGHNKFLESIAVWLDIDAPRYFWSQFDTYRAGVTKQSESTMHTLTKRNLTRDDFAAGTDMRAILIVNEAIADRDLDRAKRHLPEGFMQRRIVCTNYKALRHIVKQRHDHKLSEWQTFRTALASQLQHPELITP